MLSNETLGCSATDGCTQPPPFFPSSGDGDGEAEERDWETSDPLFSAYSREVIQRVLKCYVRQCLLILGVPGNVLSAVVFLKQGVADRIQLLLFWLAVADLAHLLSHFLLVPSCYLTDRNDVTNWDTVVNTKMAYVTLWSNFVSGTLIVVISVDRCVSLTLPFRAKRLLTYRFMVAAIFLSYFVPLLMCMPVFLAYKVTWRLDPLTNQSMAYKESTSWFPASSGLVYLIYYFPLIAKPVFFVTMIVCSIATIRALRGADAERKRMTGGGVEEEEAGSHRITKMLLVLCVAYIVLVFPEVCSAILLFAVPEYYVFKRYHNTYLVVYQFVWVASCVNSSVNFLAYFLLSSRFRATLRQCCCFGCKPFQGIKNLVTVKT